MLKKNLLVTSVLAMVLLSGAFFSLAAAQEDTAPPDTTVVPEQTRDDSPDNSTVTQDGDEVLYTMDDNSTEPQRDPAPDVPGAEDANLIATQTGTDNTMLIVAGAIALAVVVCAVGVFGWRKKFAKA
jgi:LPXTG-motif cell wall-anchored protein